MNSAFQGGMVGAGIGPSLYAQAISQASQSLHVPSPQTTPATPFHALDGVEKAVQSLEERLSMLANRLVGYGGPVNETKNVEHLQAPGLFGQVERSARDTISRVHRLHDMLSAIEAHLP